MRVRECGSRWDNIFTVPVLPVPVLIPVPVFLYVRWEIIMGRERRRIFWYTYLNYCGISNKDITAIIDNNPLKQELFAPGSNIPILSFSKGMAINPDVIFILAWNFRDEIIEECRNEGFKGKFLVPFPETPYFIK